MQLMCSDLVCATPLGYLLKKKETNNQTKKTKQPSVTSATLGMFVVYYSMSIYFITSEVKITKSF